MTQRALQAAAAPAATQAAFAGSGVAGRIALLGAAGLGYAVILMPILFVC